MSELRQRYSTKQETIIIDFFKNNPNSHYTADEVISAVLQEKISRATVYRRIERLVEEGKLIKFSFGSGISACYQYCGEHIDGAVFHFVCTKCKAVKHLDCAAVNDAFAHLTEHHKLLIDNGRTVFYGVCEECLN